MNARIWKINATAGDKIECKATIVVLEAMKMEIAVLAPQNGKGYTVASVVSEVGDVVQPGDVLVNLKEEGL